MGNMSYCRFENTASDLRDCEGALGDVLRRKDKLSEYEQRAAIQMMDTMSRMLLMVKDSLGLESDEHLVDEMANEGVGERLKEWLASAGEHDDDDDDDDDDL